MKKITKMDIVNEAREFGECFIGAMSFNPSKDCKAWNNFLSKNNIDDCYLYCDDKNWWYIVCP